MKRITKQIPRAAVWTYTSTATGYMLYKNGVPQGGAGTLGTVSHTSDGRRKHWRNVQKDREMFAAQAKAQCDRNNANGD